MTRTPRAAKISTKSARSSIAEVFCHPRTIPTRPSRFARSMSSAECTWVMRSPCSRNQPCHSAMFSIVPRKPSHTEQVQLTAVSPPRCIASKTARLHRLMTRPSMMVALSWSSFDSLMFSISGCNRR